MALIFDNYAEQHRWHAINDGVMGGVSQSAFTVQGGEGRFHGEVSLENGGGFASVRREPDAFEPMLHYAHGVILSVRGDGRTYQLRLKSTRLEDASAYRVTFTPPQRRWETLHVAWSDFEAVRRGTLLTDAPPLEPQTIHQLGFLIADRTAGPFCLRVASLKPLT
ncbi:CIA30 family protein [Halomonas llamarensis]|uniref:CIA30 family protein n=1 Tax=Halomonas llamarensis TaxID=2945104 RepID=A0ABT0SNX5_9GAMM|nr:CIA30 family protein [Halomonas llamarensis]MCL7929446.1 CIA30 family protein [Halomonas llamarensis]